MAYKQSPFPLIEGTSPVKQLGLILRASSFALKHGKRAYKFTKKYLTKSESKTKPPTTKVAKKPTVKHSKVHWHDKLRAKNMDRYQMLRNLK